MPRFAAPDAVPRSSRRPPGGRCCDLGRARDVSAGRSSRLAHARPAPSREPPAAARTAGLAIFTIGVIALVVIAQATLSAVAFASPSDASWIPGVYDAADYDDVVSLVMSATEHVAPVVPAVLEAGPPSIRCRLDCRGTAALVRSATALHQRAPPAA